MKIINHNLFKTAFVVSLALSVFMFARSRGCNDCRGFSGGSHPPRGQISRPGDGYRGNFIDVYFAEKLELSESQNASLEKIRKEYFEKTLKIDTEIKREHYDLRNLKITDDASFGKHRELLERLKTLRDQKDSFKREMKDKFYGILTDEQRETFYTLINEMRPGYRDGAAGVYFQRKGRGSPGKGYGGQKYLRCPQ